MEINKGVSERERERERITRTLFSIFKYLFKHLLKAHIFLFITCGY